MSRTITQSLDMNLSSLPFEKRIQLIDQIRTICFEQEMDGLLEQSRVPDQTKILACPKCGSIDIVKYGYSNDKPRHKCKDCNRIFTEQTKRSMIYTSKLSKATWMRFINCFVDGLTVLRSAQKCQVSEPTAYYMRLRILSLLQQTQDKWRISGGESAQVDETFVLESFKGNRSNCQDFVMPRPSYERGRRSDKSFLRDGTAKNDMICLITGVDEYRNAFFELGERGMMIATERFEETLADKFAPGSIVATDEKISYNALLKRMRVRHTTHISTDINGELSCVNALHSHFKSFLRKKRGVSTRRLPLYLAEFSWRWAMTLNDNTQQTAQRIIEKVAATDFKTTYDDLKADPYPFLGWWHTQNGTQEARRMELAHQRHLVKKAEREAQGNPELLAAVEQRRKQLTKNIQDAGFGETRTQLTGSLRRTSIRPPTLTIDMLKS